MIRPRAAHFSAFLGEHAADLVDPLEVAVAEAVQPAADLRFELESYRRRILLFTLGQITGQAGRRSPLAFEH